MPLQPLYLLETEDELQGGRRGWQLYHDKRNTNAKVPCEDSIT